MPLLEKCERIMALETEAAGLKREVEAEVGLDFDTFLNQMRRLLLPEGESA